MSRQLDGGKGSARRKEDAQAVRDNWDRIFGSKGTKAVSQEIKEHEMIRDDDPQDLSEDYERSEDDSEYDDTCTWCGGCGEGDYDGASCRNCHGTGVEPKEGGCYDDYE